MSMTRRTFIRVVGGVGLSSTVALPYVLGTDKAKKAASGVLVEAASFTKLGGWKLDTQHYQQMGGCYLLAHGMGEPVANARTTVEFPQSGSWNVWAGRKKPRNGTRNSGSSTSSASCPIVRSSP